MENQTPTPEQAKALNILKSLSGCTTEEVNFVLDIVKTLIPNNTIIVPEPSLLGRR